MYCKDHSSVVVLLKVAFPNDFEKKMCFEQISNCFAIGHLNQFCCYSRLNTKHKLIINPNSNAFHIQPKPTALQNIFRKL